MIHEIIARIIVDNLCMKKSHKTNSVELPKKSFDDIKQLTATKRNLADEVRHSGRVTEKRDILLVVTIVSFFNFF
jgi:hypothetical protein